MPSLKSTKESPSGGEKLLRLLASGAPQSEETTNKPGNGAIEQGNTKVTLNFAQGVQFILVYCLITGSIIYFRYSSLFN